MRRGYPLMMALIAMVLLAFTCPDTRAAASTSDAEYTLRSWVERPNLQGDPGNPKDDPGALANYVLIDSQTRRAKAGDTVSLTASDAGEHLRTAVRKRRYASFLCCDEAEVRADGTTVLNAYYARDVFTYEFDMVHEQSEMNVGGEVYTGGGAKYTLFAKYEQQVIVPGADNALLPKNTNPALAGAYCAGWALDERAGVKELLTYTNTITEEMLPTDDMSYEDLVFTLRGVWYDGAEQSVLACWYEQLPEHEALTDVNRRTYNGKVYVNFPATDFEFSLPKGAEPGASSAPGLIFVARLDRDSSLEGAAGRTWHFLYDRERYSVTFDTGGAGNLPEARGVMYQQNLWSSGPDWNAETTRASGGTTYRFSGWYTGDGNLVAGSLGEIYMPAKNLALYAHWERAD